MPDAKTTIVDKIGTGIATILIAVSLWCRVWHLGNIPGLNADEAEYGLKAILLLHGQHVTWVTNNHNNQNPFYFLPVLALHAAFAPSVTLLRSVAVVCGVLTLVANYLLCRRALGVPTAIATTLLLAVLPENIATSRSGWDPCQSVLADAFIVYGSLLALTEPGKSRRWLIIAFVATVIAFVVHPPNVFIACFPLIACLIKWRETVAGTLSSTMGKVRLTVIVVALGILGAVVAHVEATKIAMATAISRAPSPGFLVGYERLFSGVTGVQSVSGAPSPSMGFELLDAVATVPWVIVVGCIAWILIRRSTLRETTQLIVIGWLAEALAFAATLGGGGLTIGCDRYGLCLILPGVLALVVTVRDATEGMIRVRAGAGIAVGIVSAAMLGFVQADYFSHIEETGGTGYNQYRTGEVEPKLAAWRYIDAHLLPGTNYIVADRWWVNLPLRYFASKNSRVVVLDANNIPPDVISDYRSATMAGRTMWVNFPGANDDILGVLQAHQIPYNHDFINDYGNKPVIEIIHPEPAPTTR